VAYGNTIDAPPGDHSQGQKRRNELLLELQKVELLADEAVCRHFPRKPIHGAQFFEGPHDVHGSGLLLFFPVTPSSSLSSSIHSSFSEAAGGSTQVFDTAVQTCVQLSPQSPMCQVWAPLPQLDTVCVDGSGVDGGGGLGCGCCGGGGLGGGGGGGLGGGGLGGGGGGGLGGGGGGGGGGGLGGGGGGGGGGGEDGALQYSTTLLRSAVDVEPAL
jgi:hypothetical protein